MSNFQRIIWCFEKLSVTMTLTFLYYSNEGAESLNYCLNIKCGSTTWNKVEMLLINKPDPELGIQSMFLHESIHFTRFLEPDGTQEKFT